MSSIYALLTQENGREAFFLFEIWLLRHEDEEASQHLMERVGASEDNRFGWLP